MPNKLERVLYVEDDPVIYPLAIMAIEDFGAGVVEHCASGAQAIEKAPDFAPEILLLDVMMPGMDGIETLARLRQIESLAHVPAVFMTAKAQTLEPQVLRAAGAAAVIAKPFDPLTLWDHLNAIWNAAREARCAEPLSQAVDADAALKVLPPHGGKRFGLELDDLENAYEERRNRVLATIRTLEGGREFTCAQRTDFRRELHQLAGSAGFFAQDALGKAAARLERDLGEMSMEQAWLALQERGDGALLGMTPRTSNN
ncbi:response regulator [Novosphingobium profundi]|uniref:response regulator n=1 Tax=Novosphingobium profundi TaxID=1774954 RepID=UPI001BD9C9DA|nr:response regulator [Novosphingobium profundi]MBT0669349.1 response regulator [Novosphingobium profundi]